VIIGLVIDRWAINGRESLILIRQRVKMTLCGCSLNRRGWVKVAFGTCIQIRPGAMFNRLRIEHMDQEGVDVP